MVIPSTSTTNPFYFGGKITNPTRFVGRKAELRFITQRMAGTQMTSVAVVGGRRIGKSSLIYHVYQTYSQRLDNPQRFLVGQVSLQDARVRTEAGFLQKVGSAIAQALSQHPDAATLPAWPVTCTELVTFSQSLQALAEADLRTVLCLDEFEALLDASDEFDDRFYDGLRALMDDQLLMLIIASAKSLIYYGSRFRFVSRFFNLGNTLYLEEFPEDEARELVMLPADVTGGPPALGVRDQELALSLGGRHPFFLQMAAHYVFEAQVTGRDEDWVRTRFRRQAGPYRRLRRRLGQWMARQVWQAPAWLGRTAGWLGATCDDVRNWIVGILILLLVILFLTGVLPMQEFLTWLFQVLGLGGGSQ